MLLTVMELGETIKSYIEVVSAVITAIVIVYKWVRHQVAKWYEKNFKEHFANAEFIVRNWPEALKTQEQLKEDIKLIKGQVFPNGGNSLNDTTKKLLGEVYEVKQAITVNLKLDNTPICKANTKGDCIFVNAAWLKLAGFSDSSEAYGIGWIRAIHKEDRERLKNEWQEALRTQTQLITSFRMQNVQTGEVHNVESNCSIIRDIKGSIVEYMSALTIKK